MSAYFNQVNKLAPFVPLVPLVPAEPLVPEDPAFDFDSDCWAVTENAMPLFLTPDKVNSIDAASILDATPEAIATAR